MNITITDSKGNTHPVIAVKPYSSHPDDFYLFIVLHETGTTNHPFVVHTFNNDLGGFSNGAYCENLNVALAVFNRR